MPSRSNTQRAADRGAPNVALLIESSNAYGRGLLTGVEEYIRSHGPWSVYLSEHRRGEQPAAWLESWEGDGILARVESVEIARALEKRVLPVIDLSASGLLQGIPVVTTDDEAVARMAFEHFTERGLQNFAFCGDDRFVWSRLRGEHFARIVGGTGKPCFTFEESGKIEDGAAPDHIAKWLRGLPLPIAIFASYDYRGREVLEACRRIKLAVPEQVAVLGADDDEILCRLSPQPLSSIDLNSRRSGWIAADLLAQMMAKKAVPPNRRMIPPAGVTVRQSTDTLAVNDPRLAAILRHIRENACNHLHVEDILVRFPMARRTLEQTMRQTIGRTPQEEIRRVQLVRACDLLRGTKLTLAEIAGRCGFLHTEYLSVVFKRETGLAPNDYRKLHGKSRTGNMAKEK